jgi:hypothetical protein
MERLEEIESAIERLSPNQFRQLAEWLHSRDQQVWDEQMDADSAAGKLDFLFDEAKDAQHPWPPVK